MNDLRAAETESLIPPHGISSVVITRNKIHFISIRDPN